MSASPLDREEYIEQAYFFRAYRERLAENLTSQEILSAIHEEVLNTTRLTMAIEFLAGEIMFRGLIGEGMRHLAHYFTPFQTFVIEQSEEDRSRFDQRMALLILEREAEYRAASPTQAGMFIFQFECIARNRLGYHAGVASIASDPFYEQRWRDWIQSMRQHLGTVDFANLVYTKSQYAIDERKRRAVADASDLGDVALFGTREGRIAKANRGKDPLVMFAAFQRQLGYPAVPRPERQQDKNAIPLAVERRIQHLEKRVKILEMEAKGGIDLSEFYKGNEKPDFSQLDLNLPPPPQV